MKKRLKRFLAVVMSLALCMTSFAIPTFASSSTTTTLTVEVTYYQSMAREMLSLINDFRTDEDEAWYWNSTDTEKTYVTLSELTYDYSLEKVAMQRAAEIAVSYSHTRPNGNTCWTAYNGVYVYSAAAENIAAGYTTAKAVFEGWQEASYDYSGQGHRRNMLSSTVTSIGIACVYYNGYYYWVQDFGSSSSSANTTETTANDSATEVEVEVLNSYITAGTLSLSDSSVTLKKGETTELPSVTLSSATISSHWPTSTKVTGTVAEDDVTWTSADTSIASVGSIVANSVGTTTFTATVADSYTATLTVTVEGASIEDYTAALSEDSYEYDGTAKTPSVTVTDTSGNALTADTDYTVDYSDNTEVGTATVTITGTGDYTGTITKTFTITECSHTYESTVTKEATCAEEGIRTYTCSKCGDTYTETIEKTAHTEGTAVTENSVDATCEEDGSYDTVIYCSVCGEEISRTTTTISATGHAYDYDDIIWEWADDHSSATATVVCTNDSDHTYTYTAEIAASADSSTCTNGGEITYTATVIADGTSYTDTVTTETGAKGHTAGDAVVKNEVAATCAEEGSYDSVVYCSVCGEELSRETITTDALGHSYDSGTVTTEPTCTEKGVMTYTCTVCGDTYTADIEATGHTEGNTVIENEVDATCTETGSYESVVYCSVCGEEISRTTVTTTAKGHTFGEWTTITSPTCTDTGSRSRTCTACGLTETEDIDASGHTWEDDYTVDVEATCTTDGSKSIHCSECDATTDSTAIPATGHTYDDGKVTTGPTCTSTGVMTYTCADCGDTYTSTIAMTDHYYEESEVVEATCTEDGSITYTCSECGDTYTETIPATGHTYDDGEVTQEATCIEEGVMTYTCTECGATYEEAIPATGHTYIDEDTIAATCTEDGSVTYVCIYCDDTYTETIAATGHFYDSGTVTKEATTTEEGIITYTCAECGDTYTETIDKLDADDDTDTDNNSDDTDDNDIDNDDDADDNSDDDSDADSDDEDDDDGDSDTDSDDSTDDAADTPKTGDMNALRTWAIADILALFIALAAALKRKRYNE